MSKWYDEADEDLHNFIFYFLGAMETLPTYLQEGKSVKGQKKPNFQVFSFLAFLDWLQLGSNWSHISSTDSHNKYQINHVFIEFSDCSKLVLCSGDTDPWQSDGKYPVSEENEKKWHFFKSGRQFKKSFYFAFSLSSINCCKSCTS